VNERCDRIDCQQPAVSEITLQIGEQEEKIYHLCSSHGLEVVAVLRGIQIITNGTMIQEEMEPSNERDTHFSGFASRLWDKLHTLYLHETGKETYEQMDKQLIAQDAYDLVKHTIYHIDPYWLDALNFDEIPSRIPDFPAPPEPPANERIIAEGDLPTVN
jgi:hypothetical protein